MVAKLSIRLQPENSSKGIAVESMKLNSLPYSFAMERNIAGYALSAKELLARKKLSKSTLVNRRFVNYNPVPNRLGVSVR